MTHYHVWVMAQSPLVLCLHVALLCGGDGSVTLVLPYDTLGSLGSWGFV